MFYSVAVQQQKKKKKQKSKRLALWVSGSFTHSPPLLTPLASAEPANYGDYDYGAGSLSNFRDVKFTLANVGFIQECHQSVMLEQTEPTEGNEVEIGHHKNHQIFVRTAYANRKCQISKQ